MSLKIMRAIDEFDKKTKLKIDKEVQKLRELQQGMEKRLKGTFEKQQSIMVETNRKLQRQITSMGDSMESKLKTLAKKAKKKVKDHKDESPPKKKKGDDEPKKKKKISEVSPVKAKEKSPKKTKKVKDESDESENDDTPKEKPKVNKAPAMIKDSFSEFSISDESEYTQ